MVDEIMWTGNLGSSILRVQQAGGNALSNAVVFGTETARSVLLEKMPEEGDVAIAGPPEAAVQTFLDYSLEQIEAMIDLVRGDLDRQQRTLMGALITIDVHARDVVRYMVKTKVGAVLQGWQISPCVRQARASVRILSREITYEVSRRLFLLVGSNTVSQIGAVHLR